MDDEGGGGLLSLKAAQSRLVLAPERPPPIEEAPETLANHVRILLLVWASCRHSCQECMATQCCLLLPLAVVVGVPSRWFSAAGKNAEGQLLLECSERGPRVFWISRVNAFFHAVDRGRALGGRSSCG